MIVLQLRQGSDEWLAARARYRCASEAAPMMGVGKHMTRTELLELKKFGGEKAASYFLEGLRAKGHATEAAARAIVQEMLGEELYPITASDDDGYLLASSDGLTMLGDVGFEHKLWNAALVEAIRAGELPAAYYWQLEQQCYVLGCERIIFVCSDGTRENFASMEYRPVPGRWAALLAGWRQFDADLVDFKPTVYEPKATAETIRALPALVMRARGELTESNLDEYRIQALEFIAGINRELTTDQHFAQAAANVKFLAEGAARLKAVKLQVQSETKTIDEAFRTIDTVVAEMDRTRIELDKLVDARNKAIKAEIVMAGSAAFRAHLAALCKRLDRRALPISEPDFVAAIKGKRSIKAMRDAVDVAIANGKIAANEVADRIDTNLKAIPTLCSQDETVLLLRDLDTMTLKAPEDFVAVVGQRVVAHRAAEAVRIEAEREQIRKEERERAELAQRPAAVEPVKVMDAGAAVVAIERDDPSAAWQVVDAPAPAASKGMPDSLRSWAAQRLAPVDQWEFEVVNADLVPRHFMAIVEAHVLAALAGGAEIPGILGRKVIHRAAA